MVQIRVNDDGPGLPPEAFEVVFRIGERWDSQKLGSGLGLTIVRDLARLYGGDVRLGRADLGGISVVLKLPVAHSGKRVAVGSVRVTHRSRALRFASSLSHRRNHDAPPLIERPRTERCRCRNHRPGFARRRSCSVDGIGPSTIRVFHSEQTDSRTW